MEAPGLRQFVCRQLLGFGIAWVALGTAQAGDAANVGKSRTFLFTYDVTVTGLNPRQAARIWVQVPVTDADQTVEVAGRDVPPTATMSEEPRYRDRMLYAETTPDAGGKVHLAMTYHVVRREAGASASDDDGADRDAPDFLGPDKRVPVGGKAIAWTRDVNLPSDPMTLAHRLYDIVDDHMVYAKDRPGWGNGDSDWACESCRGNCTDFHSLFISLARAYHIPARFEIGFTIPPGRSAGAVSGYHCWAKFKPAGGGWTPVDISEASQHPELRSYYFGHLTPDRVRVSTGRDIVLSPRQDGPPLNYFVYPYVEVDGKPYPADNVTTSVSFREVSGPVDR